MRLIDSTSLILGSDGESVPLHAIVKAPTIEAEPVRHGRWVMKSTCGPHTEKPHCSVCDKIPKSICFEPYCPNCGAKMGKE